MLTIDIAMFFLKDDHNNIIFMWDGRYVSDT